MNIQYFHYFTAIQRMAERVLDTTTRADATAELHLRMKANGFNEHTVVDLMLMCHAIGRAAPLDALLQEPPPSDA